MPLCMHAPSQRNERAHRTAPPRRWPLHSFVDLSMWTRIRARREIGHIDFIVLSVFRTIVMWTKHFLSSWPARRTRAAPSSAPPLGSTAPSTIAGPTAPVPSNSYIRQEAVHLMAWLDKIEQVSEHVLSLAGHEAALPALQERRRAQPSGAGRGWSARAECDATLRRLRLLGHVCLLLHADIRECRGRLLFGSGAAGA